MSNITTLILVAGKSSRFKSNKSKIFHELAGLPIVDHIYYIAKKISKNDIIFICNEKNIKILRKKFKNCKFVLQKKQNGTADAVLSAKKYLKRNLNILILFGDSPLLTISTLRKLSHNYFKKKMLGLMLAFNSNNPSGYGRVITNANKVQKVVEELSASPEIKKITLCNSGVILCKKKLLFSFVDKIRNDNIKKEKYLPDIFEICYNHKKSFDYILCNETEMLGINTLNDFIKIDKIYQNFLKQKLINKGVKILDPQTVRVSHDTKIQKDSVIEPYVIIKSGVKIQQEVTIKSHTVIESSKIGKFSTIGPYARIRPNSLIGENVRIGNYVEIKNSIIGNGCSISHLSYIGDAKLGKKINIGAGTITCNYDGKVKNKTIIEDNAFIGSNTSIIAPIKIGRRSKIGAGSIIKSNVEKNSLVVGYHKVIKSLKNKGK